MSNSNGHSNGSIPFYRPAPEYPEAMAGQLPPFHQEAEMGVLGSILLEETVLIEVVDWLKADDFYRAAHKLIYSAMIAIYNRGTAVDLTMLVEELKYRGDLEIIGGEEYLEELVRTVPHAANGKYYAGIVQEKAKHRAMIDVAVTVIKDSYSHQFTAQELMARVADRVAELENANGEEEDGAIHAVPDPMDAKAFRGVIGECVERIEPHTEACREAVLMQALVAFASRIGRRPHWRHDFSTHRCNQYMVLVGPTGVGKGMSWTATKWLTEKSDLHWIPQSIRKGLTSGEGLIRAVKDQGGSVLCVIPEYAELLSNMRRDQSNLSHVLRDAWDGGSLQVLRSKDPLEVDDAYVNLIAHCTPTDLKIGVTGTEHGNGFTNRWVHVHAYKTKDLPEGGDFDCVTQALAPLVTKLTLALEFARTDKCFEKAIKRDAKAQARWAEVYSSLRSRPETAHGKATARAAPIVMRLALLYTILDRWNEICLPHLEAALAVWDYCDRTAMHFFGDAQLDGRLHKLENLLSQEPLGLTRTQIGRKLGNGRLSPRDLDELIQSALGTGKYLYKIESTGGAKRRVLIHRKYVNEEK
jgi:hypothetical protein